MQHGRIGLEHISGDGLKDSSVARLVGVTQVREDERHSSRFPAGRWADVTLHLGDGRVLPSGDVPASGAPETALTREEIAGKFRKYSVPVLGAARSKKLEETALALTSETANFSEVVDLCIAPIK